MSHEQESRCLNPYSNGMEIEFDYTTDGKVVQTVLILILMEWR